MINPIKNIALPVNHTAMMLREMRRPILPRVKNKTVILNRLH